MIVERFSSRQVTYVRTSPWLGLVPPLSWSRHVLDDLLDLFIPAW